MRLCAGPGGQGDILSELQDRAGLDICGCVQGERAEDEDKGGVRLPINLKIIFRNRFHLIENALVPEHFHPMGVQADMSVSSEFKDSGLIV